MKAFLITDYGVRADCKELQTAAMQAVLDLCKPCGGKVVVPRGRFYVGSLRMWSDTTLYLCEGAELFGSDDCNDYEVYDIPEGMEKNNLYEPKWNHKDEELIEKAGHGGGDFLVVQEFLNCIREDRNPPFDAYFATRMSAVAILAHRSLLEEGMPYDVPDFRKEEDRTKWEKDEITPFYGIHGEEPTIPCTSDNDYKPTENQMKAYLELLNQ
jgi:hypothetical protein